MRIRYKDPKRNVDINIRLTKEWLNIFLSYFDLDKLDKVRFRLGYYSMGHINCNCAINCRDCPFEVYETDLNYGCVGMAIKAIGKLGFGVGYSVHWSKRNNKLARAQIRKIHNILKSATKY